MQNIKIDTDTKEVETKIESVNNFINDDNPVFLFMFLEDCGPCNATKPEWEKIPDHLKKEYLDDEKIMIVELNQSFQNKFTNIGKEPMGYPCIRFIKGKTIKEYEGARTGEAFAEWIESIVKGVKGVKGSTIKNNAVGGAKSKSSKKSSKKSNKKNKIGGKTQKKSCKEMYCDKVYVPKMLKNSKELLTYFEKVPKNKLTFAQKKMITKFKTKKHIDENKKVFVKECETYFCNAGCKDTVFEDGTTLPKAIINKYKDNKMLLEQLKEQRTFLFKDKKTVLTDNFYNGLKPKDVKKLKKDGADSGCIKQIIN